MRTQCAIDCSIKCGILSIDRCVLSERTDETCIVSSSQNKSMCTFAVDGNGTTRTKCNAVQLAGKAHHTRGGISSRTIEYGRVYIPAIRAYYPGEIACNDWKLGIYICSEGAF